MSEYVNTLAVTLFGESAMVDFGKQLAAACPQGAVIFLEGNLGMGKTTLCRGVLQGLGHRGAVKSPTYTLVEPYSIQRKDGSIKPVYHADLYRLQDPEELSFIGFDEYLDEPEALVIIEWASRADSYLPPPTLFIDMTQSVSDDNDTEARQVHLRVSKAGQAQGLDLSQLSI